MSVSFLGLLGGAEPLKEHPPRKLRDLSEIVYDTCRS